MTEPIRLRAQLMEIGARVTDPPGVQFTFLGDFGDATLRLMAQVGGHFSILMVADQVEGPAPVPSVE